MRASTISSLALARVRHDRAGVSNTHPPRGTASHMLLLPTLALAGRTWGGAHAPRRSASNEPPASRIPLRPAASAGLHELRGRAERRGPRACAPANREVAALQKIYKYSHKCSLAGAEGSVFQRAVRAAPSKST